MIPGTEALKIRILRENKQTRKKHSSMTDDSLNFCLSLIPGMSRPDPSLMIMHIDIISLQTS